MPVEVPPAISQWEVAPAMARNLGDFRPKSLSQFIGFDDVKRNLSEQIEVLDHDIQRSIER